MPYAENGRVSQDPIAGGVKITDDEYQQAIEGMKQGLMVRVADGAVALVQPPPGGEKYWLAPREEHETAPGEEVPTGAVTVPPPSDYHIIDGGQWVEDAALKQQWFMDAIQSRADAEINGGITVTVGGVDYLVATTASARALIAGAKIRAQEAIDAGTSITRKIPTDKGIKTANETQLVALFDLVETKHQKIMDRVEELHAKVADGTITEADIDTGWP